MTYTHVLDNDILSDLQRGDQSIAAKLASVGWARVATTIVSGYEQLRGRFKQIGKAEQCRERGKLPEAYRRLHETIDFFKGVPVLDYTDQAEQCHDELRRQGVTLQKVAPLDLRTGCIALSLGATLVTRNRRHYEHVTGLRIEDWSS